MVTSGTIESLEILENKTGFTQLAIYEFFFEYLCQETLKHFTQKLVFKIGTFLIKIAAPIPFYCLWSRQGAERGKGSPFLLNISFLILTIMDVNLHTCTWQHGSKTSVG